MEEVDTFFVKPGEYCQVDVDEQELLRRWTLKVSRGKPVYGSMPITICSRTQQAFCELQDAVAHVDQSGTDDLAVVWVKVEFDELGQWTVQRRAEPPTEDEVAAEAAQRPLTVMVSTLSYNAINLPQKKEHGVMWSHGEPKRHLSLMDMKRQLYSASAATTAQELAHKQGPPFVPRTISLTGIPPEASASDIRIAFEPLRERSRQPSNWIENVEMKLVQRTGRATVLFRSEAGSEIVLQNKTVPINVAVSSAQAVKSLYNRRLDHLVHETIATVTVSPKLDLNPCRIQHQLG